MDVKAELYLDARNTLGEGPVWDEETNGLLWVDIEGKALFIHDTLSMETETHHFDQRIGCFALSRKEENQRIICALHDGIYEYDRADRHLTALAKPETDKPDNRFNDGKCDPGGRFWAGTMKMGDQAPEAALYRLDSDGFLTKAWSKITCSNGLCWSHDGKTMYYIDTPTNEVAAFDFNAKTGSISNRRAVISFSEEMGSPDGMTIDAEGMLWIAHWGGWQVSRWNPATGAKIGIVHVPVERVTSCAFGGVGMNELFITTSRVDVKEDELSRQPHAGGIFRVVLDVRGLPFHRFGSISTD